MHDYCWSTHARYIASCIPFLGGSSPPVRKAELDKDLPPARVAIIGAGIGGCFSAKFLRELGGQDLDIHIWNKKESTIGGRSATVKVGDHWYEAGAAVAHTSNQYLMDATEEYGEDSARRGW